MRVARVQSPSSGLAPGEVGRLLIFSEADKTTFSNHRHDLAQALLRLETALGMVGRGFDFTSTEGSRYFAQLKEAVEVVKAESELLKDIYRDE